MGCSPIEDLRETIINSFSTYQEVYGTKDWCEDGIRRAEEAKTIGQLKNLEEIIETAWDHQCWYRSIGNERL